MNSFADSQPARLTQRPAMVRTLFRTLAIMVCATVAHQCRAQNVLVNPSFEALPILGAGQSDVANGGSKNIVIQAGASGYTSAISGISGWTATLDAPLRVGTDGGMNRGKAASGTRSIFNNRWEASFYQSTSPVVAGAVYNASIKVFLRDASQGGRLRLIAGTVDADGNPKDGSSIVAERTFAGSTWTRFVPDVVAVKEQWTSVTLSYTAPSTGSVVGLPLIFAFRLADSSRGTVDFDDASLTVTPPKPDLVPSATSLSSERIAGRSLDVAWSVSNQGLGTAAGPWVDRVYISSVGPDDPGTPIGDPIPSPATLAPTGSYSGSTSIVLPMEEGTRWISVRTDAASPGTVVESNEANNRVAFASIQITLPRPDLQPELVTIASSAHIEDPASISWTVRNRGNTDALGNWVDRVYLSADAVLSADDIQVGTGTPRNGPLAPDNPYQASTDAPIPAVTPGDYYILVSTDADQQVSEGTGESNNVLASSTPVSILPKLFPDLRITNISPPSNAKPGSLAEIGYVITNIGEGVARGSWDETVSVSLDATAGSDIVATTQRFDGPILPGKSVVRRSNLTVPNVPVGTNWFLVNVDSRNGGEVAESDESNNTLLAPGCFDCETPNLVLNGSFEDGDFQGGLGTSYNSVGPGSTKVTNWLPTQNGIDWHQAVEFGPAFKGFRMADLTAGSSLGGISQTLTTIVGQQYTLTFALAGPNTGFQNPREVFVDVAGISRTFSVPASSGAPLLWETKSLTFTAVAPSTTISFRGSQLPGEYWGAVIDDVSLVVVPTPDLVVQTAPTGPQSAVFGQSVHLEWVGTNGGTGRVLLPWNDAIVLSPTPNPLDGTTIGQSPQNQPPLIPSATYNGTLDLVLPTSLSLPSGRYYLFVATDQGNTVAERDEQNNFSPPLAIDLTVPAAPDLVAEDFSGFASAHIGDSVSLSWTVRNRGIAQAEGSWKDRVYLSKDAIVDNADIAFGPGSIRNGPLPIGAPYQVAPVATVPEVTPGSYKLLLSLDDDKQLAEGPGESNNVLVLATDVTILARPLPDLRVSNITPPPPNAAPGSVAEITYTITNAGEGSAEGSWDESVFGSLDDAVGSDIAGPTTRFSGPILPGKSVLRRYNITVPSVPAGDYWFVVSVDTRNGGEIAESNESNNALIVPVCITCDSPNLEVTSVAAPSAGVAGSSVDVTWTVKNIGQGTTISSWIDRIVLGTSCNDPSPVVLRELRRTTILLKDEEYTLTRSVNLPPELDGTRFISVITDAYNELPEPGGEGDNTTCSANATNITLPAGPDLTVTSVQTPLSTGTFNAPFTVRWTVRNIGDQPAVAPWNDRVFLSGNPVRDGEDFPLEPLRPATVTLDPNGEYTAEQDVQLPLRASLPAGTYHLLVATDAGNALREQRESNQWAASGAVVIDRPPLPDLRVVSISAPAAACPGSQVDVVYTVTNAGNAPAEGLWVERILASSDDTVGNDYFGSQLTATGPIEPGALVTRQGKLTVPNEGLSYRASVCLDPTSTLFESDETNNCSLAFSPATVARPDLVPVTIAATPASVLADGSLRITWGTRNSGPCETPASFIDSVFLVSVDGLQSYLLGTNPHPAVVQPGQTDPQDQAFPVPGRIEGEFRIQVRTDSADNILESNETNNLASSSGVITVAQPARPDIFIIPASVTPPANGLVSSEGTVEYLVTNLGSIDARGPWIDRIVARRVGPTPGPDLDIGTSSFKDTIVAGGIAAVSAKVNLPTEPGDYTICVILDSGDSLNEGLAGGEDNNRECSIGSFNADGYSVVVTPSITQGQAGTPVTVTGYAEKLSNGQRVAADTPVLVRHNVRGFDRTLRLTTKANGEFGSPAPARLELLPSEAGRYVITAGPPGAIAPTPEVIVVLHGMIATPDFKDIRVAPGYSPATGQLELFNSGDITLTNLRADITGAPPGLAVDLLLAGEPLTGKSIVGQQVIRPTFQLSAPAGTSSFDGPVTINWKTDQGTSATTVLHVRIAPRDPQLTATPGSLVAGMITSTNADPRQSIVEFTIKNTGGLPTGPIRVELPTDASWMTLASPQTIASLGPDEESKVVLTLAPTLSERLGDFTGNLGLRFANSTQFQSVPYTFTHKSLARGSVRIVAADEETYWAPGRPPLANTTVTIRDARTNELKETQTTGNDGTVTFPELDEGAYYVEATRDGHRPYKGLVEAKRSGVSTATAFLSRQAVTYSWRVDPVQIEDRYRFVLDATFVTNVFKPVLDITIIDAQTGAVSRVVDLDDVVDERLFYVRIENKGLIDAPNVRLNTVDAPNWQVELLTSQVGTVHAGQDNAVTVPMVVRKLNPFASSSESGGQCRVPEMSTCFDLQCDTLRTTCDSIPWRWTNVCTGPGGYVTGGGGPGGPGSGSGTTTNNIPTFQCNTVCACGNIPIRGQDFIRCVGSEPLVLSAQCGTELTWSVEGGPYELLGQCLPSVRLPSDKPRRYTVKAYCKCPEGQQLVARYVVTFVEVRATLTRASTGEAVDLTAKSESLDVFAGERFTLAATVQPEGWYKASWTTTAPSSLFVDWTYGAIPQLIPYDHKQLETPTPPPFCVLGSDTVTLSLELTPTASGLPSPCSGGSVSLHLKRPAVVQVASILERPRALGSILALRTVIELGITAEFIDDNTVLPHIDGEYAFFQVLGATTRKATYQTSKDPSSLAFLCGATAGESTGRLDLLAPYADATFSRGVPIRFMDFPRGVAEVKDVASDSQIDFPISNNYQFGTEAFPAVSTLMYKPAGGMYVPVRSLSYYSSGNAVSSPDFPDVVSLGDPIPPRDTPVVWSGVSSTVAYPEWNGIFTPPALGVCP